MKANELMIGDWIKGESNIVARVIEIKEYLIRIDAGMGRGVFEPKELFPIPITPKILEKNGFKFQSVCICDNKDAWIWEWPSDKEYELPHCFMLMSHHNKKKYPYFWIYAPNNPDIKYVHELQHALRLCGIEKEIEL